MAVGRLIKAIGAQLLRASTSMAGAKELRGLNECLREVGEKRKSALAKQERNRQPGTYITSWSEDDQYANDRFY